MSQAYTLHYVVSDALTKRAMVSWSRPAQNRRQLWLFFAACVAVGALIGLSIGWLGIDKIITSPMLLSGLVGFYLGLALWLVMHKRDVRRLTAFTARQREKQGPLTATFGPDEVTIDSALSRSTFAWGCVDDVIAMDGATALRSGALVYALPHSALPDGVSAKQFHQDLVSWQAAAQ